MSALSNQLMVKAESTYGTRIVPDRPFEFTADGLKKRMPRIASAGHRPGDEGVRYDHWINGRTDAGGTLEFEVGNKGFGIWWDLAMGSTSSVADGLGKHYTTKFGDQLGKSCTIQKGLSDTAPAVDPFDYTGCKVTGLAFSQALDAFLKLAVTIDAQKEDTTQTLATATAPAITELFHWDQMAVTVDAVALKVTSGDWHLNTPMKVDRWFGGQTLKSEPIRNGKRDVGGTLVCEFDSMSKYNSAIADLPTGTPHVVVITYTAATTYDTAKPFKIVFTFNQCRLDPDTPVANAEDVIALNLPFVAFQGASEMATIEYYTSDATI